MKTFHISIGDRSYHVEVGDSNGSPMTVIVDGEEFQVDVRSAGDMGASPVSTDQSFPPRSQGTMAEGPSRMTAPMPGTVWDIVVQPGARVQGGQILCALEAMKMKSPIRALRAGTVSQVKVSEGQSVHHGDLLFVIE